MEFLLPIIGGLLYWLIPNIGDTLFNTSDEGSQFKHKVTYNLPHEEKLIVEGEFVDGFLTTGGVVFRYESLWIDNDIRLEGFYDQTTSKLSNVSVVLKEQLLSYALPDDYSFIIYNDEQTEKIKKRPPKDSNRDTMWKVECIYPADSYTVDSVTIKILYPSIPKSTHWRVVATWLRNSRRVILAPPKCEIFFPNDNIYKGSLFDNANSQTSGEYVWSSGDSFEGLMCPYKDSSQNSFDGYMQIIPSKGCLTLKNGETYLETTDFFKAFVAYLSLNPSIAQTITPSEYLPLFLKGQEEERLRKQEEDRKRQEELNFLLQNKEETIAQFINLIVDGEEKQKFTIDDKLTSLELAGIYAVLATKKNSIVNSGWLSFVLENTTLDNGKIEIWLRECNTNKKDCRHIELEEVTFATCKPRNELKDITCAEIGLPNLYKLEFEFNGWTYTLEEPLSDSRIKNIKRSSKEYWENKYGTTYGTAVYHKEVQLGMTIDMIRAIKGRNGELSTRVYSDGEVYQTLEFGSLLFGTYESYHFENGKLTYYKITD